MAGLRALGHAGVRAIAVGSTPAAAGLWSRHAAARAVIPDSRDDPAGFVAQVADVAAQAGGAVVYPGLEESLDALVDAWSRLDSNVAMPWPGAAVVRRLRDKRNLPGLAGDSGIRVPVTLGEGPASEVSRARPEFPCIIKAALPERGLKLTHIIQSERELRAVLDPLSPDDLVVLQEWLSGPRAGLVLLVDRDGRLAARFQHVARRTWPREAGSSSVTTSVPPDEDLAERAARMLASEGYFGLADLDLILTPDGPALIDVNTRYFGCLPLALASGVNFPAAWHALVSGSPVVAPRDYRTGVRFRWLEAEMLAAKHGSPRTLLESVPRPRVGAVWDRHDPVPSIVLSGAAVTSRFRRRITGRVRARARSSDTTAPLFAPPRAPSTEN